jgi:6-phosphogluconolactonase
VSPSTPSRITRTVVGLDAFAQVAARQLLVAAAEAVRERGRFRVALAGGSTPRRVHAALLTDERTPASNVEAWDVWFGDERCVPADDVESNYRMADETLFSKLAPPPCVHRVPTELGAPAEIASAYEAELVREFRLRPGEWPIFDLVLLGMGPDGHTASLFPGDPVLGETRRLVVAVRGAKPPPDRVTFTLPVLCAARHVLFLVAGADKAAALRDVLAPGGASRLPAARVRPTPGEVTWLVDDSASRLLPGAE